MHKQNKLYNAYNASSRGLAGGLLWWYVSRWMRLYGCVVVGVQVEVHLTRVVRVVAGRCAQILRIRIDDFVPLYGAADGDPLSPDNPAMNENKARFVDLKQIQVPIAG